MEPPTKSKASEQWLFVPCAGPEGRKQHVGQRAHINRHVQPRLRTAVSNFDDSEAKRQVPAQARSKSRARRKTKIDKDARFEEALRSATGPALKTHHKRPEYTVPAAEESPGVLDGATGKCLLCNPPEDTNSATTLCSACVCSTGIGLVTQRTDNSLCTKLQILGFFVDDFQTRRKDRIRRYRHPTFWTELLESETREEPLLSNAVEAVTLSHLAGKTGSLTIEFRAREVYGKWIRMLARAVEEPHVRRFFTTRSVVLSIFTMGLMALFSNPIASSLDHGVWSSHVWASQKFLGASGPEGLDFTRRTDRVICHNLKAASLCLGVSNRKEFLAETPEWVQFFQTYYQKQVEAGVSVWQHDVEKLPRLLRLVDTKLDDATAECVSDQLRTMRLKSQLSIVPEEATAVSLRNSFDPRIEEQVFLMQDKTFPSYYTFQEIEDWDHNRLTWLVWCIDIIVDCTILRLHKRTNLHGGVHSPEYKSAEQRAFTATRFFCRSAWFMSTFDNLASAKWMAICFHMARNVFTCVGFQAQKELEFTNTCGAATEARVQRLIREGRMSLCPVGDLSAGFVSACTW